MLRKALCTISYARNRPESTLKDAYCASLAISIERKKRLRTPVRQRCSHTYGRVCPWHRPMATRMSGFSFGSEGIGLLSTDSQVRFSAAQPVFLLEANKEYALAYKISSAIGNVSQSRCCFGACSCSLSISAFARRTRCAWSAQRARDTSLIKVFVELLKSENLVLPLCLSVCLPVP